MLSPRSIAPATWRALAAVPLLALVVIGVAACSPSAPAIEDVSPHKGDGNVAGDAPIKVTFDRPVDRQSVVSRFQLEPPLTACTPHVCPVTWTDRIMTFSHPKIEFQPDTKYAVHIKPGYRDTAGRVNNIEHVWEFRTETAPSLQSSTPGLDGKGVAPDVDVTLQFSRQMQPPAPDQLTLVDPEADIPTAVPYHVSLDPGDQSRVVVAPVHLLRSRHSYRLSLTADFKDVRHNRLGRPFTLNFTTGDADLSRSLAFSVLDAGGAAGQRIAVLRPPASLGAPAPSLRVVYESTLPIGDFAWSSDARHLYTNEGTPAQLMRVDVTTGVAQATGVQSASFAVSPAQDEVAYVAPDRSLHLWSPPPAPGAAPVAGTAPAPAAASADIAIPAAGTQAGPPSWSGDGRRLALTIDGPAGDIHSALALAILDRATLSRFVVADVKLTPVVAGTAPRWSFDGLAVAFARDLPGGPEVWTFGPLVTQGSGLTRIGPLHSAELAWSSDASTLYAAGDSGAGTPRLLRRSPAQPVDGQPRGFTALRGSVAGDEMPATPSFDRRVAFLRSAGGKVQLWLVNGDGSGLSQLTFEKYDSLDKLPAFGVDLPRWAPAGSTP